MTLEERISELERQLTKVKHQQLTADQFTFNLIKQPFIDGLIIHTGLAADLPTGTTHVKAYFATDSNELSIYNGSGWVTVTLS